MAVLGSVLAILVAMAGPAARAAAQPDRDALKVIPLGAVLDGATDGYDLDLYINGKREAAKTEIEALPAEVRRLVWLVILAKTVMPGGHNHGLWGFFRRSPAAFAPEVGRALAESGLRRQAEAFAHAMALFGQPYIRDNDRRFPQAERPETRRQLATLDGAFGTPEEYWQAVKQLVGRSPALTAWADGRRAAMTDADRLRWLMDQLYAMNPDASGTVIRCWPRPYQVLVLLDVFAGEVDNGGVSQFFFNASGTLAPEVAGALREVGLPKQADAVQRGIDLFPRPYPADTGLRQKLYGEFGASPLHRRLYALTDDVRGDAVLDAMVGLAKREDILPH